MKQYLRDLTPEEVIDRLNQGDKVYYEDSKGKRFYYRVYKGMTIRYNEDDQVDGYNRSIYSTGEAFFETEEVQLETGLIYTTLNNKHVKIISMDQQGWFLGVVLSEGENFGDTLSWRSNGQFFKGNKKSDWDIVEEYYKD